jgi:hypothetical protein
MKLHVTIYKVSNLPSKFTPLEESKAFEHEKWVQKKKNAKQRRVFSLGLIILNLNLEETEQNKQIVVI